VTGRTFKREGDAATGMDGERGDEPGDASGGAQTPKTLMPAVSLT